METRLPPKAQTLTDGILPNKWSERWRTPGSGPSLAECASAVGVGQGDRLLGHVDPMGRRADTLAD